MFNVLCVGLGALLFLVSLANLWRIYDLPLAKNYKPWWVVLFFFIIFFMIGYCAFLVMLLSGKTFVRLETLVAQVFLWGAVFVLIISSLFLMLADGQIKIVTEAAMKKKEFEERTREKEELELKTMLLGAQVETSLDGILAIDAAGKAILFNKHFSEIWRIPQQILETKNDAKMLEFVSNQLKDPGEFIRKIQYLYSHQTESSREDVLFADGRTIDRYSAPLIGVDGKNYGRIWFFRDITERKREEEKLRETEGKYANIIEKSNDQIFMIGEGYKFLSINKTAAEMSGKSPQEIIGKPVSEVFPEIVAAQFLKNIKNVFETGKNISLDEKIIVMGHETYNNTSLNPIRDDAGKVVAVTGIVRDITDRKKAEEALSNKVKELEKITGIMEDREDRIIELKAQVKELKKRLGEV